MGYPHRGKETAGGGLLGGAQELTPSFVCVSVCREESLMLVISLLEKIQQYEEAQSLVGMFHGGGVG